MVPFLMCFGPAAYIRLHLWRDSFSVQMGVNN